MIEGTDQLRTLMVFYDQDVGQANQQNNPTYQHEYRQLVPSGRPIYDTKQEVFGCFMMTEGVVAHANYWVLNSGDDNSDDEVRKIGPTYGKISLYVKSTI